MSFEILRYILTAVLLVTAVVTDLKKREIPNLLCVAVATAAFIGFDTESLTGLSVAVIYFVMAAMTGGVGGGDVKLFAALSIALGVWGSLSLLLISHAAMLLFFAVYATVCKFKGKTADKALPFAPFILTGYIFTIMIGVCI